MLFQQNAVVHSRAFIHSLIKTYTHVQEISHLGKGTVSAKAFKLFAVHLGLLIKEGPCQR